MKVQMRVQVTGTRDGVEWPAPGSVVDLPDEEAASLIAGGMALRVAGQEPETASAPEPETAALPAPRRRRTKEA